MIVTLGAVHAARPAAIRNLTMDDLDMSNRRIAIDGHTQRLGELTYRALRTWLEQRRTTWPHTPNRHVLISKSTALGSEPISKGYYLFHLRRHGVGLDRIRKDRILHEAPDRRTGPAAPRPGLQPLPHHREPIRFYRPEPA